ncbi:Peptidyl-prolyl cis-trans isomerase-like 4 [Entomophthora muscae]|uniref:Peptidyl-prolyl cis-trans isomerase-like 4 n=1 Tax=Entomophthora muscae TaxID=34485 RepID=A0ACC2T5J0_9FUNG|nr:Peptidyl-prolyl cis-trans isomerase-like 4 [Entomophthora muscae]
MSVLIETSLGDIVIDLHVQECPRTTLNFIKLCKTKYYNYSSFHNVQRDFMAQTGDPTGTGQGGESVFHLLKGENNPRYFKPEFHPKLKHTKKGTVSMAVSSSHNSAIGDSISLAGSQFFITLGDDLDYLDGKYSVFGQVAEGFETLDKINEAYCDDSGKPYRDIRIKHTLILDDPFPDPEGLEIPEHSPQPDSEILKSLRLAEDEELEPDLPPEQLEKLTREREARAQALTLEMVGDLPFADVKPPENVLFVCKLNPVTRDEDLELIFSRFGPVASCEIIRDAKTGDSLSYAFVELKIKRTARKLILKWTMS